MTMAADVDLYTKTEVLLEALPYVQAFRGSTFVVKIGGSFMEAEEAQRSVAGDLAFLAAIGIRVVVVHGGGPQIGELMDRFYANYSPDASLQDAAWQVDLMQRQIARDALPTITFTERVYWAAYGQLHVDLDLATTVPLYRSRSEPLAALQAQRAEVLGADLELARREAGTRFLRDLLALSLLRSVSADLLAALERVEAGGWRPAASLADALTLHHGDRELQSLHRHVLVMQEFVEAQAREHEDRVIRSLGVAATLAPALPSFDELAAWALPTTTDLQLCVATSPLIAQASMHHRLQALEVRAQAAPDLRLDLHGGAAYRNGGLSATVRLEARLPLPARLADLDQVPPAGQSPYCDHGHPIAFTTLAAPPR